MKTKEQEDFILQQARSIMLGRMRQPGGVINDVGMIQQYLQSEYAALQNEQFGCMFLDSSYGLINHTRMFRGTINHCATYPREIAREALVQNAVFVILVHNHPAHNPLPSEDDVSMSLKIKELLASLDIVLFDHIIVAGTNMYSMRAGEKLG
jgi:DNA repair protein RadC